MHILLSIGVIILLVLFIVLMANVFISFLIMTHFGGAYFAETSHKRLESVMRLADLKKNDKILDLGSGDGRIVLAFAKLGYQATGIEINPVLVMIAKLKTYLSGMSNLATISQGDMWQFNTASYSVVVVYGMPFMFERLEKKFKKELKPGSRIISIMFPFPNLKEVKQENSCPTSPLQPVSMYAFEALICLCLFFGMCYS